MRIPSGVGGKFPTQKPAIDKVAEHIDDVVTVAESITSGQFDKVSVPEVKVVATGIKEVKQVAEVEQYVRMLAQDLSNIDLIGSQLAGVLNVSNNMAVVLLLHSRMADLLDIKKSLVHIDAVALNEERINSVFEIIPEIATLVSHMNSLVHIAQAMPQLEAVFKNLDVILLTSSNVEHIVNVSTNIDTILEASVYVNEFYTLVGQIKESEANITSLESSTKAQAEVATAQASIATTQASEATKQADISTAQASGANDSAIQAAGSATTAGTNANLATTEANKAKGYASDALTSKNAAASSATTASTGATTATTKAAEALATEQRVLSAAESQISAVTAQGNTQVARVTAQGNTQDSRVVAQGDTQVSRVVASVDAQVAQVREALRRSYAEAGLNVKGYTQYGVTLTSTSDVVIHSVSGKGYSWNGVYPEGGYVVTPETDPTLPGSGYVPRTDVVLRSELADINGAGMIGGLIAKDATIYVPSDYSTIGGALDFLRTKTIVTGATVTIKVADGNYVLTSGINGNHPDGDRIRLIGNQVAPSNCVITISGLATFNAFTVSNGNVFGFLDGFRFDQPSKAVLAQNFSAVIAMNGATINCGTHIETNNWYYGINASYNSTIICDYAKVTNAGDVGIWAFCGSFINARYAQSNNCSDTVNGWGFGFQAEYGSTVNCEGATATGNNIAGFAALSGSTVRALSSNSSGNVGSGYFVRGGGVIEAYSSTASNNTRYGIELLDGSGGIYGPSGSGNTLGLVNKFAYLDAATGSARVTNSSGQLRIDNSDNYGIFFNTPGGLQFGIDHVVNAVNSFRMSGSVTGAGLTIAAQGSDSKVRAYLAAKGADVAGLVSNGKVALQGYSSSASNVNYVQADSSLSGIGVMLSAQGADANIDLKLNPKGAGYLQVKAGYTAGALSPTGYISIKDDTGTVRRVLIG